MCGSGRFLLPLLAQGLDIEGTDTSTDMLDACRTNAQARGLQPKLQQQSLERLTLARRFQLIFIPAGSFGLLIEQSVVEAGLERIFAAMLPGATFLVEVERQRARQPESSGTWGGRWVDRPDGARILISWLNQYSGFANVSHSVHRYELVKDGCLLQQEYEDFRVRSYEPGEFRGLLERAGFTEVSELETYSERAPSADDEASVFCCKKAQAGGVVQA